MFDKLIVYEGYQRLKCSELKTSNSELYLAKL